MLKFHCPRLLIVLFFLTGNSLFALEALPPAPKVLILPFKVYAQKELPYLGTEIPAMIASQLGQEGAEIIGPFQTSPPDPQALASSMERLLALQADEAEARAYGHSQKADYLLYGSISRIGGNISLDTQLIRLAVNAPGRRFFADGEGIENLGAIVNDLSMHISIALFKRETVVAIRIEGNQRIEEDAILKVIKTAPGSLLSAKQISADLKAIYAMGYFEDIRIQAEPTENGKELVFTITEKPTIREIEIKGNSVFETKEIMENLDISTGAIVNNFKIKSNVGRIENMYKEKNYHNVVVTYTVLPLEHNQADIEFNIEEGNKVKIKEIRFEGNKAYDADALKKEMETDEKGFWSWLTSSGELEPDELSQDVGRLGAFYQNNGYIDAKVGEPLVEFKEDWIYITIKIEEGEQFKVGTVDIEGDLEYPKEELLTAIKINETELYSRKVVRNDVLTLSDKYGDKGYANADVYPRIDKDMEKMAVNIVFVIRKGKQVYFEKILITGNTVTRDKVIRRQLTVYEQELYSGQKLKRSIRNLYRLDYFEDIQVNKLPGSADDQKILQIDVKEKATGMFSFGAGYSSEEDFFTMASVNQRNLFGRGQTLNVKAELGGATTRYTISFTEPWLFDIPLSAGIDLYNWEKDYDTYTKDSKGGNLRFGYRIFDFTTAYISYAFEKARIYDIHPSAPQDIQYLWGDNITSSVTLSLRYDSRDRMFNTTEGQEHGVSVEYAGGNLGGDIGFIKYIAETGWYIPLVWKFVGFIHGKVGYIEENNMGIPPDYERFYLGGINSLRGYKWHDVTALDNLDKEIGGDKYFQGNFELLFPIIQEAGLMGLVFLDCGDVYGVRENMDFEDPYRSYGGGFRWYSPIGPIRLEYGQMIKPVIDPYSKTEKKRGRWEFTMGSAF